MVRDVFFYGTLMDADILAAVLRTRRVPRARLRPATLHGYRRTALKGVSYPTLLPDPGAPPVDGVLFRQCTRREWARLVAYEDREYTVGMVRVDTAQGPRQARVFLAGPRHGTKASPRAWGLEDWRRRSKPGYLKRLARVSPATPLPSVR